MRHLGHNLQIYCRQKLKADRPFKLARLWRNWSDVVGDAAAELARPLGRRKRTLRLGVEEGAAMQEVSFYAPQILEDVNSYLGEVFFDKVQSELLMGKTPLDEVGRRAIAKQMPQRPPNLGNALKHMDPDSPVTRCYLAYVASFGENQETSHTPEGAAGDSHGRNQF